MKRILLVKTSSLGDVIHNLPVINDILHHHPDAHIDWVVEEAFADIPRLHPKVKNIHQVATRRWRKNLLKQNTWHEIRECKHLLSAQPYDAIIDTQGLVKSAIIACGASGQRYGYDKHSIREAFASHFYQHTYNISYQQHAVIRNRSLVAQSLGYIIPNGAPDYGIHAPLLEIESLNIEINNPYVIGLHGTSRNSKLWPESHWISLAAALKAQQLKLLLPWASQAEYTRAHRIASVATNALVLPKLRIAQLASLISKARYAIGVDTGLSHLSAALSTPTVAIYTDTNPELTGVMAGANAPAINLGNINVVPNVDEVLKALEALST
ncbi:MAG: lipopolysaccharide heptosyltransferase I [Methylotenera sp.]|nr:lipopolysaccharide heptosyltransferase I [Methylotenera sp.]MDP1754022.1 lipopolysaccharide heptosyltransferase I [Methylotenera sp.]MDP1960216.1 lipopolysaccharide heptosyltransferase I [Methylotenera sp.]MDP3303382.1 lipopolysaccharide heptosyltransferase I [Methylotenera sp.]MDP3942519.1 lipopolysaccharide heptosyltransferase I [Methylotenera sp.]